MATHDEFEQANARAAKMKKRYPTAVGSRYDRKTKQIIIDLSSGSAIRLIPEETVGLENATPEELEISKISPSGFGIHFPRLDADLYLPALIDRLMPGAKLGSSSK